jgi:hypothetical protein
MKLTIYFTDGSTHTGDDEAQATVDTLTRWYRDAPADAVAVLKWPDGTQYISKRHIIRIVVE